MMLLKSNAETLNSDQKLEMDIVSFLDLQKYFNF